MKNNINSESLIFEFTNKKLFDFSQITQDHNKLHSDDLFARNLGYEGGIIVHGALILSISNSLIANYVGSGCLILSQEAKFLSPCYVGYKCRFSIESIHDHLGGAYREFKVLVKSVDSKETVFSKIKYLIKIP